MTRPFRFGLEKVLELRRQREEQAMLAHAKAKARYQRQAELLDDLRRRLAEAEVELRARAGISAADIWLWSTYRQAAETDIARAALLLQSLAKELQFAKQELVARAKDRKILEKLKEKQAERHARECERCEQKEFDEGSALRFRHADI